MVKTIFLGSSAIVTSVGDDKQRIMGWAGALSDSFEQFIHDFNASQIELTRNHRSAPRLIEIQNIIAKIINQNTVDAIVSSKHNELEGVCEVWNFQTHLDEAFFVASSIAKRIQEENVIPSDICIIVKQHEHIYARNIIAELGKQGIQARIEKEYHDLLAEECVQLIIDFLKLATTEKAHDSWVRVSETLSFVQGYDHDKDHTKILKMESKLDEHILQIKREFIQVGDRQEFCVNENPNLCSVRPLSLFSSFKHAY
ncbi:3'-5' exonuclease [Shouchella clausii]|uniref:3'-5' exonuclease n=1 Tax=Shouchella clausii TaxID=79880 RepID=UPI00211EFC5E|nr:3'-5' exonuclease [Shouchella clausii]